MSFWRLARHRRGWLRLSPLIILLPLPHFYQGNKDPFPTFSIEVLRILNVASSQLFPNVYGYIRTFEMVCKNLDVTSTVEVINAQSAIVPHQSMDPNSLDFYMVDPYFSTFSNISASNLSYLSPRSCMSLRSLQTLLRHLHHHRIWSYSLSLIFRLPFEKVYVKQKILLHIIFIYVIIVFPLCIIFACLLFLFLKF